MVMPGKCCNRSRINVARPAFVQPIGLYMQLLNALLEFAEADYVARVVHGNVRRMLAVNAEDLIARVNTRGGGGS